MHHSGYNSLKTDCTDNLAKVDKGPSISCPLPALRSKFPGAPFQGEAENHKKRPWCSEQDSHSHYLIQIPLNSQRHVLALGCLLKGPAMLLTSFSPRDSLRLSDTPRPRLMRRKPLLAHLQQDVAQEALAAQLAQPPGDLGLAHLAAHSALHSAMPTWLPLVPDLKRVQRLKHEPTEAGP